jgi:uncharacterized membrane protein
MLMMRIRVKAWHIALWTLAAICMLGQSTRMIYQGLFQPGSYYQPNGVDLVFDWLTMLVVGLALFSFVVTQFYRYVKESRERKGSQEPNETKAANHSLIRE